jgi:DNA-binding GntR family transcriptional regulator
MADAADAMAFIAAAVAAGTITPSEAAELSRLVESCMRAIEAGDFVQRLQVLEAKLDVTKPQARRPIKRN